MFYACNRKLKMHLSQKFNFCLLFLFYSSISLCGFVLYFRFDFPMEQNEKRLKEKCKLTIAVVVVCMRFRWIIVIDRSKEVSCTCSPQYPEHLVRQLTEFTSSFPSQRTPTNFYFAQMWCANLFASFVCCFSSSAASSFVVVLFFFLVFLVEKVWFLLIYFVFFFVLQVQKIHPWQIYLF